MKRGEIVEWVLILLAVLALWPLILGYQTAWSRLVMVAALAAMIWVLVRRVGRVRRR
jgi:hypothetical protein